MTIPKLERVQSVDGLDGPWLSLEELAQIEPFRRIKKAKLNTNLRETPGAAPSIKAAVRREYQPGETICRAGDYGSTAFLLLEGRAMARVPEAAAPAPVRGRERGSLGRLARLFARRTKNRREHAPTAVELGEVSRYGHWNARRTPAEQEIRPGDFFGIDTCINFYPREATVQAAERCVAIEMLRSVLDTARDAGADGERIDQLYAATAVRSELFAHAVFEELSEAQLDELAAASALLTNDSDEVADDVIYREGDAAEALYLVRAGSIKLAHNRDGHDLIFTYLGRGSVFGLENLRPGRASARLTLHCVSHPADFVDVEVAGAVTLGRKPGCSVRFPSGRREVGRLHCRLEERDGDVYLVDNDSVNLTLLNGERIREAIVAAGDVITIVDFVFELRGAALAETSVEVPRRLATAAGLDNFEVVKIPAALVRHMVRQNPSFARGAAAGPKSQGGSAATPAHLQDLVALGLQNSQNTLLIDLDRCTRCDECVRACATAHDGVARFTRDGPRFGNYLVTLACRSCTDPKCMVGCPVGSIRRKDSLEIHIEDWCIGCQRCANQCPFGNINMVELAAEKAEEPPPLRATVCDLCAGYDGPNCVYACPHDAAIRVHPGAFLSPLDR